MFKTLLKTDRQIMDDLARASAGLLFMSESDYPFEVIQWPGTSELSADFIRSLTHESEDCLIQEIEAEQFLSKGRCQTVLKTLRENLSSIKTYKVGLINMPVYVVGRSPEGNWLGVSTRVVET